MDVIPILKINRPFVIQHGITGYIESNCINAYTGEWVVFPLEMADGEIAELRIPFEAAIDGGLVTCDNEDEYEYDD